MVRYDIRIELEKIASKRRTVTYGYLMKKFRISRGHPKGLGIAGVLSDIGRYEQKRGAPGFGAIVVRKDTGYPGGGFFCDSDLPSSLRRQRSRSSDPWLSDAEKRFVEKERAMIWDYYQKHFAGGRRFTRT